MKKSHAIHYAVTCTALVVILALPCLGAVVIQEIYPTPFGTASGGEAVLLYNQGDHDVDISGWTLGTDSSATDATVPDNSSLSQHGLYLIADSGWSMLKDDPTWAAASHEEAITLRDSIGTVTLRAANGTVVDSIVYPTPQKGMAYWRIGPSIGQGEMIATDPLFSAPLDALFLLGVTGVSTSSPASNSNISVTDNGTPVRSVRPLPGRTTYLTVNVVADQEPTLTFLGTSQVMESMGEHRWTADIAIPYDATPGIANVSTDIGLSTTFEILPLLAIDSDTSALDLGNSSSVTGDTIYGSGGPTIRNAGNVPLDVYVSRTAIQRNGSRTTGQVQLDAGSGFVNVTSTTAQLVTLAVHESAPLSVLVNAPSGGQTGDYTSTIAFQLKKA
jgi:hypothetical protein